MPRKGWKTLTITEEMYNDFRAEWEKQEKEQRKHGVSSFSSFITKLIYEALEEEKKRNP